MITKFFNKEEVKEDLNESKAEQDKIKQAWRTIMAALTKAGLYELLQSEIDIIVDALWSAIALNEDLNSQAEELKSKIEQLNKEVEDIKNKLDELTKEYNEHENDDNFEELRKEIFDKRRELSNRRRQIQYTELPALQRELKYVTSEKKNEIADEEDWTECLSNLPNEIEYEDLEVEVHEDEDDEPVGWNYKTDSIIYRTYPARDGYINEYTYTVEPTEELVCEFLKKEKDQVTRKDLVCLDDDLYYEFIYDKFIDEAKEACLDAWESGDIDSDRVSWIEYEPDYDY